MQVAIGKSYVQYLSEVDEKWKLIVQSSHKCHSTIITSIFETMQETPMCKEDAVELRDVLESLEDDEKSPVEEVGEKSPVEKDDEKSPVVEKSPSVTSEGQEDQEEEEELADELSQESSWTG